MGHRLIVYLAIAFTVICGLQAIPFYLSNDDGTEDNSTTKLTPAELWGIGVHGEFNNSIVAAPLVTSTDIQLRKQTEVESNDTNYRVKRSGGCGCGCCCCPCCCCCCPCCCCKCCCCCCKPCCCCCCKPCCCCCCKPCCCCCCKPCCCCCPCCCCGCGCGCGGGGRRKRAIDFDRFENAGNSTLIKRSAAFNELVSEKFISPNYYHVCKDHKRQNFSRCAGCSGRNCAACDAKKCPAGAAGQCNPKQCANMCRHNNGPMGPMGAMGKMMPGGKCPPCPPNARMQCPKGPMACPKGPQNCPKNCPPNLRAGQCKCSPRMCRN